MVDNPVVADSMEGMEDLGVADNLVVAYPRKEIEDNRVVADPQEGMEGQAVAVADPQERMEGLKMTDNLVVADSQEGMEDQEVADNLVLPDSQEGMVDDYQGEVESLEGDIPFVLGRNSLT